jgi:hypothetical protein
MSITVRKPGILTFPCPLPFFRLLLLQRLSRMPIRQAETALRQAGGPQRHMTDDDRQLVTLFVRNSRLRADRNTLFQEVWAEPMLTVSKRYGISDVGLAKICRKLDIPVPPRGYWARIAHGQKITKPGLPVLKAGIPQSVEISPSSRRERSSRPSRASAQLTEQDDAYRIVVDEVLSRPHVGWWI